MSSPPPIPSSLIASIREGNCVAFVGAGFSAPALPTWRELLTELAKKPPDHEGLESWLAREELPSRDFEAIAGLLAERYRGLQGLEDEIRAVFQRTPRAEGVERVRARVEVLEQIPFHLVLTTNYDSFLRSSRVPDASTFGELLTMAPRRWTHALDWDRPGARSTLDPERILKLHGDLDRPGNPVVLAARSYRGRTHELAGYRPFLRALFATKTILFIGFSFTDAYINDLRSELLAVLGLDGARRGLDYAISADFTPEARRYYEKHEGLVVIPYDPKDTAHEGFDERLRELRDATSPEASLMRVLQGRRILWFDPNPDNNVYGRQRLEALRAVAPETVTTLDAAIEALGSEPSFDLVISHFGHSPAGRSNAEMLLERMREARIAVPVIVFASGAQRAVNRPKVLRLGAFAYEHEWGELFARIEDLFRDGPPRPPS